MAYYLSRDRILSLLSAQTLPLPIRASLQGEDVPMAAALLSNAVGEYLLQAIADRSIKTLEDLHFEGTLVEGVAFIYNGHVTGKGFAMTNKTSALRLTEKLDGPHAGKQLVIDFSKNGLVNDTAYSRLSGSTRLFIFGYVANMDGATIRAVPFAIGDLIENASPIPSLFLRTLELPPEEIEQFQGVADAWLPSKAAFNRMATVPEKTVKELICTLLGEHSVPNDWGGEESDVFSANLLVNGQRRTAAFLLKGPAQFHSMKPTDLGKNGDQLYRLFNIPAQIYVVQHCHAIGAAVRKQAEAFALARSFTQPCQIVFMDGITTARLLKKHGLWPSATPRTRSGNVI